MKNGSMSKQQKLELSDWREKILGRILIIGLSLGGVAFVPGAVMAFQDENLAIFILNTVVWLLAAAVFVSRKIRYEIRAVVTLTLIFAIGVYIIFFYGFLSGGPFCLFAFAVTAGLFMGVRTALAALLINAMTLMVFGWLAASGLWGQNLLFFPSLLRGGVAWSTYMLMNAMVAVSVAVMVRGMAELAEKEKVSHNRALDKQKALHESEAKFKFLTESTTDIIWMLDKDLKTTYVSPSVESVLGFTPEERKAQIPEKMVTPESWEQIAGAFAEQHPLDGRSDTDTSRVNYIEVEYYHKNGSTVWMENSVKAIRDKTGSLTGVYGVSRDITERRQMEESLRLSEQRFRSLFSNMNDGVAVYAAENEGEDFTFIDFNKAGEKIDDISKETLVGRTLREMFPGVEEFGLLDVLKRVWTTGNPEHHPTAMYRDKRINGYRENFVYKLSTGELVSIYSDEGLRHSHDQFQSLVANIPGVTYRCRLDKNWTMMFMSTKTEQLTGYPETDFIDNYLRSYASVIHPDDTETVEKAVCKSIKSGTPWEIEYRILRKDGSERWVYEKGSGITDKDGQIQFLDGFILDITERKRTERDLHETHSLLTGIIAQSPIPMVVASSDGELTIFNQAVNEQLGLDEESEIRPGVNLSEMHPPWKDYGVDGK